MISLTAGTALIMWMGELITQRGIGNGMSLLIFASVVSQLPANFGAVRAESGLIAMLPVGVMFTGVLVAIVFVEQGQRRIPVQFAKRQVGRTHVRRPEHLHPAQGQRLRRDPDHLRQLDAVPAGDHRPGAAGRGPPTARRQLGLRGAELHRRPLPAGHQPRSTWSSTAC